MYYVCIIDRTNKTVHYAESFEDKADAVRRRRDFDYECELHALKPNGTLAVGATLETYLDEKPFAFPTPAEEAAALAASIRAQRDGLLSQTDYTELPSNQARYTAGEKAAWAAYRQDLRDVPQQEGFPDSIDWPVAPGA